MRGIEKERDRVREKRWAVERQHYTVRIKEHLGFPPVDNADMDTRQGGQKDIRFLGEKKGHREGRERGREEV